MSIRRRSLRWLDLAIAVCAAGGLTVSVLYGAQFTSDQSGPDFKTLYASAWCFVHRMDAYSIPNLQAVFIANGIAQPARWYGHAPVYPWTTLALISPLTLLSMRAACYAVTILSGALLAVAIAALMRYAGKRFELGLVWRMGIAALCAGSPLVVFGFEMGNVSRAASALCFVSFVWRDSGSPRNRRVRRWVAATALATAFVLKPHLAVWVGLGMALLPERNGRAVALRALGVVTGFTAFTAAIAGAMGTLGMQTHAYLAMLRSETGAGASMSAASREMLPVVSQITSLDSIAGFWINSPIWRVGLTILGLAGAGILLLWQTRRVCSERGALLATGAWCALGMLATYHRAHDAALLLLLTPWIVDRVRHAPLAWHSWAMAALYCSMSVSIDLSRVESLVAAAPAHSPISFVLLRQAGLASLLILAVTQLALGRENASRRTQRAQTMEPENLKAAA